MSVSLQKLHFLLTSLYKLGLVGGVLEHAHFSASSCHIRELLGELAHTEKYGNPFIRILFSTLA